MRNSTKQYAFPPQAFFGGNIPKNKIYERVSATASIKQKFVQQVEKIIWLYKLAPETINLPAGQFVKEIQVFELRQKEGVATIDETILRTLDKAISHPVLYQLTHNNSLQYAMAYKRPHETEADKWVVGEYFYSSTLKNTAAANTLPQALNLQALYEILLRQLMPAPAHAKETLAAQINRLQQLASLQKQAAQLENSLHKEKQFNRKVALNSQLRILQSQLKNLQTP